MDDQHTTQLTFFIGENVHQVDAESITPKTSLNTYLREKIHLTATKRCCLEGGCGACIVVVEDRDPVTQENRIYAVNSCLVSIFSCHGLRIHTLEGIGDPVKGIHPLQKTLAEMNGSQCGYCSGGMIMNMFALLKQGKLTKQEIENSFGGNICRCTGYRPILDAWKTFANVDIEDITPCTSNCNSNCRKTCVKPLKFKGTPSWTKVYFLKDLLETLAIIDVPYVLVAGNTGHGVFKNYVEPQMYIQITSVKELITWIVTPNEIVFGGNVTLTNVMKVLADAATKHPNLKYLSKVVDHLDLVANIPVRNIATLAGNLMLKYRNPQFQSDIFLILETINAKIVLIDHTSTEKIVSPEDFLKENLKLHVIKNIIITGYGDKFSFGSYKIMDKTQNTLATVNAGFLVELQNNIVHTCRIVYGGINPKFVHAKNTESLLEGKNLFDNNTLQKAYQLLRDEIKPDHILPDFDPEYRMKLAVSLFYKFVLSIAPPQKVSTRHKSGANLLERPLSSGVQEFTPQEAKFPLTKPMVKLEALSQTTGQADYIEDLPDLPGQLYCSFVCAKMAANSVITNIDASPALTIPGVVRFIGLKDIPGKNIWSPKSSSIFLVDEYLFCEGTVLYYDQPVGIIVAKTQELADLAADKVKITANTSNNKPLIDIRTVLKEPESVKQERITHLTDVVRKKKGTDIKKVVKGDFYIGSQYHFHMELQCCSVVPRDNGVDVITSSQWLDANQVGIATVLNLKHTQVNIEVKRLGGGFGAKIMRNTPVSCAAALAAYVLRKPVKMRLNLETNMRVLGKRYPLYAKYEAAVNDKGIFQYLDADLYSDFGVGGNEPIDSVLVDMFQNCYITDTWQFSTYIVRTDTHANCWTRAPGTKEGLCAIEAIFEHIASTLNIDPLEMKIANTNAQKHQKIIDFHKDMSTWADIDNRRKKIEIFNNENRWKKRGMSIVPMAWTLEVQANYVALVSIFHGDGSVAIAHGGVEMGQGINTKVAQVAAYKLGIPMDLIECKSTNTLCNPNNSSSGGSLTGEAVSYATMKACDILLERMAPIKKKLKNPSWPELVKACFDDFVNLSASSFFSPKEPNIQEYFIYGLGAAEVEVDILTGNNQLLRVDIIEDVGDSMNPLIDIGQVEGAFVMGIGYYTTERVVISEVGEVVTNNTWTYKVPGPKDIPVDFRIKFPNGIPNKVGVLQTKAIAEPPSCLTATVPLAIRNAVASARKDSDPNQPSWYKFDDCSSIENTFLNSLNDFNQYTL